MDKNKNTTLPVYRRIAVDFSQDIVSGKYREGQKLSGRSILSSQYGVSPETIRKAVYLLKDVGVFDVKNTSGVYLISVQKAADFLMQFHEVQRVNNAKNELFAWMERQVSETSAAMEKIQFIINASGRLNKSTPYTPYEIVVPPASAVAGKSISDLNFWHMTGATIVAIERGEQTILSPGPYSSLLIGDILYIVGDEQALNAAIHFVADGGNNPKQ